MGIMRLTLVRIANRPTYCIGKLYIDGKWFCDTIEDTDRGLCDEMSEKEILKRKVKGETAIPTGIYQVLITYSPKYKKQMPLINNVKCYSGIRIHSGNTSKDTEGCLIVGKNKEVGKVLESRITFNALFKRLQQAKDKIIIDIQRKYTV
jgi:hypothetical protein